MKTYKMILLAKIFFSVVFFILFILSVFTVIHGEASFPMLIAGIIMAVFCPIVAIGFNKLSINVTTESIEVRSLPFIPGTGILNWNEIAEVRSEYFLFPESGGITLIPKPETGKKLIRFIISGMPIELIRDILANVPKDAKVHLYPYLKRRAEGKQIIYYNK